MDSRTIEQVRKNETKLINEIKDLEQQCKQQKEVINNAIEYINADYVNGRIDGLSWLEVRNLLDILKEVSK